jgi:hypothetical protein
MYQLLLRAFIAWKEQCPSLMIPYFVPMGSGDLQAYLQLLPPSWRHYFPMQQTYWAGRIGRSLFRIHGSGEAPDYFRRVDQRRGEWNPTLGCLSSIETYDSHGNLVRGDMPQILQQIRQVGNGKIEGFVIVVDLPEPMGVEEIAKIATNRASN